ncbi:trimeric intracellular cation channel family protein [Halogeometricum luteum]|uniref:Trimeric intracellular cation channel family protein n=1 Tax=Halogeometricum luteum TaxID=2950537 RepID=A0ABU2G043_9EURY|nr:trimeric intracellular cation channel family protein [Halogeometricum sp. S3BR5-2]MDS0293528.1 trimeric intracellular cation channel family protein [Halogeometricum sp. S3BR5-2]
MNVVGLLAFAVAGSLKASDAGLDLFGVAVLGVLTALGGGTVRDVLVNRPPASLTTTGDMTVALVGVALAVAISRRASEHARVLDSRAFLVSDAVGLAAFAATGALVGTDAGLAPYGVVVLAAVTAVGGGSLADVLLGRVPVVLREDFYATPALLGGGVFLLARLAGAPTGIPAGACAGVVFAVRMLALRREWRLPRV